MGGHRNLIIVLSILVPLLVVSSLAIAKLQSAPDKGKLLTSAVQLKDMQVFSFGSNPNQSSVLDMLTNLEVSVERSLGTENISRVQSFNLSERSLFIFDGLWIDIHSEDAALQGLLRKAISKKVGFVSMGETSRLFTVLDKVGIHHLGRDGSGNLRNPASSNPTLVGFRLKYATNPNGSSYSFPSMLITNPQNTESSVTALADWLGQ
jgi:hypothetical protein